MKPMNAGLCKSGKGTGDQMNLSNAALKFGLFLALAIPTPSFSGDFPSNATLNNPLLMTKDEAKCENCLKKLSAMCDNENKRCLERNDAKVCQAYYEKCKDSVRGRCGGPSLCD
jgi:hypothetical protein